MEKHERSFGGLRKNTEGTEAIGATGEGAEEAYFFLKKNLDYVPFSFVVYEPDALMLLILN